MWNFKIYLNNSASVLEQNFPTTLYQNKFLNSENPDHSETGSTVNRPGRHLWFLSPPIKYRYISLFLVSGELSLLRRITLLDINYRQIIGYLQWLLYNVHGPGRFLIENIGRCDRLCKETLIEAANHTKHAVLAENLVLFKRKSRDTEKSDVSVYLSQTHVNGKEQAKKRQEKFSLVNWKYGQNQVS